MPRSYDVLTDFGLRAPEGQEDALDLVSVSPSALVVVWRYKHPVTFSREKGASFSTVATDCVALRDKPLFIADDLQQLQVQTSKSSHVNQMSATLLPGMNYLTEIFPGDWVAAWIVNDEDSISQLISKIQKTGACNGFRSGLKFLGRVSAVRKRIQQDPGGVRKSSYLLNAAGFTELDASLYYEPQLAADAVGTATEYLRKTAININKMIADNGQGIDLQKAISLYLAAFFGTGIPKTGGFQNQDDRTRNTEGLDDPNAFIIPDPVARMLGVEKGSKSTGAFAYTDVLELLHGIQNYQLDFISSVARELFGLSCSQGEGGLGLAELYSGQTVAGSTSTSSDADRMFGMIFAPDGVPTDGSRNRKTPSQMIGTFLPSPPQFSGQRTVWSILQQYLNPTVNEIYTCLRTNPRGEIFPTLVVRQLPFSSGVISDQYRPKPVATITDPEVLKQQEKADRAVLKKSKQEYDDMMKIRAKVDEAHKLVLTRFFEVPRWLIHPILIKSVDIGRSDATRINFVHIQPEQGTASHTKTSFLVRDPPVRDDLDVYRGGLRPYMATVPCAPSDAIGRRAGEWQYIMSDILMGGHLLLNGTMETQGILSPICPGDNLEFDGHVFHIESVSHSYGISPGGKVFKTSLALSHGMNARQSQASDLGIYAGSSADDLQSHDPGIGRDAGFSPSRPSLPETGKSSEAGIDDHTVNNPYWRGES